MAGKWPSTCTCCGGGSICDLDLNSTGGDDGFCGDYTVEPGDIGKTLRFTFDPQNQPDRMIVGRNPSAACIPGDVTNNINNMAAAVIDTGCVSNSGALGQPLPTNPYEYVIQPGDTTIRVVVQPNCAGGTGTAWSITVECIDAVLGELGFSLLSNTWNTLLGYAVEFDGDHYRLDWGLGESDPTGSITAGFQGGALDEWSINLQTFITARPGSFPLTISVWGYKDNPNSIPGVGTATLTLLKDANWTNGPSTSTASNCSLAGIPGFGPDGMFDARIVGEKLYDIVVTAGGDVSFSFAR